MKGWAIIELDIQANRDHYRTPVIRTEPRWRCRQGNNRKPRYEN